MKIATILPIPYLELEKDQPYHMALAHLFDEPDYFNFFKAESEKGNFILMDNGVVETGTPLPIEKLEELAHAVGATEFILPDSLNDCLKTLMKGEKALKVWSADIPVMAVPQGSNMEEWLYCLSIMLSWPVRSIGISKFTKEFIESRFDLLSFCRDLVESDKQIHLLGCNYYNDDISMIEKAFPGRIRGIDSGMATFYTQVGWEMRRGMDKPNVELDFDRDHLNQELLMTNIAKWKAMCNFGCDKGEQI